MATQLVTTAQQNTKVADTSKVVDAMAINWKLVSALLGGTDKMRKAGETLLPKWVDETQDNYDKRLAKATLFPAFKRTVETLAARPFSKPVTINDDVPSDIKELLNDVDMEGRNVDQFAADMMVVGLGYGIGGILVDFKKNPKPGVSTIAEEKAAGLRPYWVRVLPEQVLGWRAKTINGATKLTQLRIKECIEEDYGEFGTRDVEQVRVLEPGNYRVYRQPITANGSTGSGWELVESGTTTLTEIPFVPVYGERTGFMQAKPPLLELAHLNVKHWQSQSDQDTLMHVARVPILTVIGIEDDPTKPFTLVVGAAGAVRLPLGAEMKYVEHTGAAIDAGKVSLDDLKEDMRQSGAELLVLKPSPTTATEVASDNAVGMCALQKMALQLQDALNEAMELTGKWLGKGDNGGGTLKLFTDFGAATLAEASATLLNTLAAQRKLSVRTLYNELKRRGILGPDVDYEDEMNQIETEGPMLDALAPPPPPAPPGSPKPPGPPAGPPVPPLQ